MRSKRGEIFQSDINECESFSFSVKFVECVLYTHICIRVLCGSFNEISLESHSNVICSFGEKVDVYALP